MKVGKIAHAGVVISTPDIRCLMDPVLESPYENGANVLDPRVEIDVELVVRDVNLVVISHEHMDHFSPRSLRRIDRSVAVLYPRGAALIERALQRLGFANATAVEVGEQIEIGATTLVPTPSRAPFAEIGMLFKSNERVFWNLVDSTVDDAIISSIRRLAGPPELLFAAYQPLIEDMFDGCANMAFPYDEYAKLLRAVWAIRPRRVGLIASGFLYTRPWLNDRGFPITERQFGTDLQRCAPDLSVLHIPHGATVDLEQACAIDLEGVLGVRRTGELHTRYDWRPDRGFPALRDENAFEYPLDLLQQEVTGFLDRELLPRLETVDPTWLERMERLGVTWRLEVLFPNGSTAYRLLDLVAARPLVWRPDDGETFAKMHTSITASGFVGLLRARHNSYSFIFNEIRWMHRLYEVHPGGVVNSGTRFDEPLSKILCHEINERHVEAELDRIEQEPAP